MKGQWPPGDVVTASRVCAGLDPKEHEGAIYGWKDIEPKQFAPLDRVEDLRKDSFYTLGGAAVGSVIHTGLVWWLSAG
jgi:hypothetical protein